MVDGARVGTPAGRRLLPALAALADLLPDHGLRRGSTVAVAGCPSLALALLAGPSAAGSWCAAVGLPSLGLVAAAELGVVLPRLALVPDPGREWALVVATVVDAVDVVLVAPPTGGTRPADARRLVARCRERGAVLVVAGLWAGAELRLGVAASRWEGLGDGHGHLRARRVEVVAEGRGAAARPRRSWLWLPAEGGGVAVAAPPYELGAESEPRACDSHTATSRR
ncbi:MAG: hypothetical protein ACRDY5_09045 [Acidimicrobiales bacterium]